jgi:hypothetical protein
LDNNNKNCENMDANWKVTLMEFREERIV